MYIVLLIASNQLRSPQLVDNKTSYLTFMHHRSFPQGWFIDEFEKTVLMEASAVAIVVGELSLNSTKFSKRSSDPEIRIFADSSLPQAESFSVIGFNILNFFLNYFDISYAFKKLDFFVLRNFPRKTMSSYGVIYLRYRIKKLIIGNKTIRKIICFKNINS